ncbi:hypothetical protein ACQKGC_22740 [Allorhizobium pseudoryzae]|uniref:hypothetical protein n=1 Tax=Allorhizobium pseudoryzae TaxID=379684 RepID=UPI003CFDFA71
MSTDLIENVVLPDRYEVLQREAPEGLGTIVVPVEPALQHIDAIKRRMRVSGRGAFLILRGNSGAGKSTFLHTVKLYRENVKTHSISGGASIRGYLDRFTPTAGGDLDILVLEERDAAISFTEQELEDWLHSINGFIRSDRGQKCLVVWPCNTDPLRDRLISLARSIGGESLLGSPEGSFGFTGPDNTSYPAIAQRTLATLNQGAGFNDLGLTDETVRELAGVSGTIGAFMGNLQVKIGTLQQDVLSLIPKEQFRLWVVVVAGNDPVGDVAGLTRGSLSAIDTDRLLSSTEANIVKELKTFPDKIGLLGTVLDAKILHLPVKAATAVVRAFADQPLKTKLRREGFALKPDDRGDALNRLTATELASIFRLGPQGPLPRGPKVGDKSVEAFEKLASIASSDDTALNRAFGMALESAGLIKSFLVEQDFGTGLKRRTDILADTENGPVRIEVMWRKSTGRAEIANYTLTKLQNYGKAIGFLN